MHVPLMQVPLGGVQPARHAAVLPAHRLRQPHHPVAGGCLPLHTRRGWEPGRYLDQRHGTRVLWGLDCRGDVDGCYLAMWWPGAVPHLLGRAYRIRRRLDRNDCRIPYVFPVLGRMPESSKASLKPRACCQVRPASDRVRTPRRRRRRTSLPDGARSAGGRRRTPAPRRLHPPATEQ